MLKLLYTASITRNICKQETAKLLQHKFIDNHLQTYRVFKISEKVVPDAVRLIVYLLLLTTRSNYSQYYY